jgi:hypothetical protein
VTTAGIDAGGKPITNVGAGTNGTDAANVDQVKAVQAKADNAVQYDKNADGTPSKRRGHAGRPRMQTARPRRHP